MNRPSSEAANTYRLYVIELDDAVCKRTTCASQFSGKPHVYVGETAKSPEERFAEHLAGVRSVRVGREFGVRLRPRLYRSRGPFPTRAAVRVAEGHLANHLRDRGYCVFGGH